MPYIYHIAWPVRDPSILLVLATQDEPDQRLTVNPVRAANDLQAAQHPPAIAHILSLFRTAVEPAAGNLPLAQPPAQLVDIDEIQSARNGEGRDAGEDLARVRLCAGAHAVAAVKVGAGGDVVHSFGHVDKVQQAEQGEGVERAVEETCVFFAPLVAGKGARFFVLQSGDDYVGESV